MPTLNEFCREICWQELMNFFENLRAERLYHAEHFYPFHNIAYVNSFWVISEKHVWALCSIFRNAAVFFDETKILTQLWAYYAKKKS